MLFTGVFVRTFTDETFKEVLQFAMKAKPIVGDAIPEQMVLGCIRKQSEEVMSNKPVGS